MGRLLKTYLKAALGVLSAVVVFQAAQSMLTLYLPRISADIIDKGVIRHNTRYIWARGSFMMLVTIAQMLTSIVSVYFASRAAMGLGRDIRRDLFHRVTGFSAREVGHFGAPSLITRITNDVQQVQMAVLMACTMAVTAPITAIGGAVRLLTNTSLQSGRLMALMFPTVLLVVNLSSIIVLWFGAGRIDSGHMQIGALVAFLSYVTQILFAVMMATFMFTMLPRAAVS